MSDDGTNNDSTSIGDGSAMNMAQAQSSSILNKAAIIAQIQANPTFISVGSFISDSITPTLNSGNVYNAIILRAVGTVVNQTTVQIIVFNEGTSTEVAYYLNSQP
jgi:hypothetical protein